MKTKTDTLRRILLFLSVFLVVEGVVVYAAEGVSLLVAGGSTMAATFLATLIYTALLLYIYIGKGWCPRIVLTPNSVLPHRSRRTRTGLYLAVGVAAAASILPSLALQELLPSLPDIAEDATQQLIHSPWGFLMVCLLAPVLEETVFRGAILHTLLQRSRGTVVPLLVSALVFSVVHFNPAQMPHAFLLGILIGWIFVRTHSILPTILFHFVNNTIVFLLASLVPEINDQSLSDLFHGSTATLIAATAASTAVLLLTLRLIFRLTTGGNRP